MAELIEIKKIGEFTALSPKSALTLQIAAELETIFNDLIDQGRLDVIFDCRGSNVVDSFGLELLIKMNETLKGHGKRLKLIGLNDVWRDIMVATRLSHVFSIYKDLHTAVTSRR